MTEQDWQKVEYAWRHMNSMILIDADGYALRMVFEWNSRSRTGYMIPYVNGSHKAIWYIKGKDGNWCEEAKRFMQTKSSSMFSRKVVKSATESLGKKKVKELGWTKTFESKNFGWKSFRAFKKHLKENNVKLELREVYPTEPQES